MGTCTAANAASQPLRTNHSTGTSVRPGVVPLHAPGLDDRGVR
ncbi:hypothetical protein [Plantibacter flavus]